MGRRANTSRRIRKSQMNDKVTGKLADPGAWPRSRSRFIHAIVGPFPEDPMTISALHRLTVNDREIIERRRAEYIAAFNREDIAAMTDYASADAIGMAPNRPAVRG